MKTLLVIMAISLVGCAHHAEYRQPQSFLEQAEQNMYAVGAYFNSDEFAESLVSCKKKSPQKKGRIDCLADKVEVGMAHVNEYCSDIDTARVRGEYLINRDKFVSERNANPPKGFSGSAWRGNEDLRDAYYRLELYERLARDAQVHAHANQEYAQHVHLVNQYNQSIDQQSQAWHNLGTSVQQMQTYSQIRELQNQQRQLQWQQQTGGNGIRPY